MVKFDDNIQQFHSIKKNTSCDIIFSHVTIFKSLSNHVTLSFSHVTLFSISSVAASITASITSVTPISINSLHSFSSFTDL